MEEMKPCFGTFRERPTCRRCTFRAACEVYSAREMPPDHQRVSGVISGDSVEWEKFTPLIFPEFCFFDDPPERRKKERLFDPGQILHLLQLLDQLTTHSLCLFRELILSPVVTVADLAARHGVTRQSMNEKILFLSITKPWTSSLLLKCRRHTSGHVRIDRMKEYHN